MKKSKLILLSLFSVLFFSCVDKQPNELNPDSTEFTIRKFGLNYSAKSAKTTIEDITVKRTNHENNNKLIEVSSNLINLNPNINYFAIGEFYSNDSKLIAYEVYYFENDLMHSFFKIDNNGNYNEVFNKKDKGINIANIEFILTYYLEEYNSIKFHLNINNSFDFEKTSGYTDMEMFKTVKLFNISNNNKLTNRESINYEIVNNMGSGVCAGCYTTLVYGTCNEWLECRSDRICKVSEISNDNRFKSSFPLVDLMDNKENYYKLRDDFLNSSRTGKKFISYYYSLSTYININLLNFSDYSLIVSLLPDIDDAVNKILNGGEDEIIIDNEFKNKILSLISNLKSKSNDTYYQLILEDLKAEINNLSLKTKNAFKEELQPFE